jgi:uncharacterized protein
VQPRIDDVTTAELTYRGSSATASAVEKADAQRESWRSSRLASVTGPRGNLALIETRWLPAGETITDADALAGHPSTVTLTRLERRNIDTGEPESGIRLWDSASPAIKAFEEVSLFDFAPEWVIEAHYAPVAGDRTVQFEHIRDNGGSRELVVPGDITFSLDGVEHRLSAFDDGGVLLLVFGDPTNGRDDADGTYESGRFLFVERPGSSDAGSGSGLGSDFDTASAVILDFNKSFVPPCGFSDQYNCPLPPRNNRFARDVRAGEKKVIFTPGFGSH